MKFNYKSRKGFTLIELLVVIGILAVLAAIAIPSVAGLIDRANVSADETNANEMTNAIERFASEYELYVQDIGSGALNPNDLDSAQGRVYNVTGATTRGDITAIEKAQSVKVADVGDEVAIYRDTKYPVNNATLHKIVENYMKTSSSTFEPKQSDCNYYYSPDCGLVVCTETDKSETADLNALVVSGKDAKGKELGAQTQWINITEGTSTGSSVSLPEKGKTLEQYTWEEVRDIIAAGKATEYGFVVGGTKTLSINGATKTATIIGLNHDGSNTATFMVGGISNRYMDDSMTNVGWENCDMREWFNGDVLATMDIKDLIKPVTKKSNAGNHVETIIETKDSLFLLSVVEIGLTVPSHYNPTLLNQEGTRYEYFTDVSKITSFGSCLYLRTPSPVDNILYLSFDWNTVGNLGSSSYQAAPAFVIG